jgi:hypothetical protein
MGEKDIPVKHRKLKKIDEYREKIPLAAEKQYLTLWAQ